MKGALAIVSAVTTFGVLVAFSSCGNHGCNEAGCLTGVQISVRTLDGTWPDGAYTLTITHDGTTHACALNLPEDRLGTGSVTEWSCEPTLGVPGARFDQDATCEEHRTADAVSQSCTPIPDHYTVSAFVQGTPKNVTIALARDGTTLLEQSVAPSYSDSYPNGKDCEPACRGASVELMVQ
jgi:hypothetical protein